MNIKSRLNSSPFWVSKPVSSYFWSKLKFSLLNEDFWHWLRIKIALSSKLGNPKLKFGQSIKKFNNGRSMLKIHSNLDINSSKLTLCRGCWGRWASCRGRRTWWVFNGYCRRSQRFTTWITFGFRWKLLSLQKRIWFLLLYCHFYC